MCGIGFANLVDGQNVRMIQSRGGLGLLPESSHTLIVLSDICVQNFQSYGAIKLPVPSQIDLAHAARAYFGADFVTTKLSAL